MSLNLSIPLFSDVLNIKGFYVEPTTNKIIEDIGTDWRLLGYNPTGFRGANIVANYIPSRICINALDIPVPLHRTSLVSASLSFNFASGIPDIAVEPENPIPGGGVDTTQPATSVDWRTPFVKDFGGYNNVYVGLSTQSGDYVPVFNFGTINTVPKTRQFNTTLNANQSVTIPLTNILKYHTDKISWEKNNRVVIFLSGIPTGLGAGGAIDLFSLNLSLQYNPVPPFAPSNLTVSETDYRQVTLNWDQPSDNGGATILNYNIQYGLISGSNNYIANWNNAGTSNSTSFVIENLFVDETYVFRVAGINVSGIGEYSSQSNPITISKSLAPISSLNYNEANYTRIRLRRDTFSQWSGINPTLALGETGYELDTKRLKVGDGITPWNNLSYVTVESSSIDFPDPPNINMIIASSSDNLPNNDRIILNLSSGQRLNIVGEEGVTVDYSNSYKRLSIRSDKLYNPINFGTIINPTNSGVPGSLLYDNSWLYFCVKENYWQRSPLDKQWFDIASVSVSNTSGSYPSTSTIIFDKYKFKIETDGDPYPALAGRPLTNDGTAPRLGFGQGSTIRDQNHIFILDYRAGQNSTNPMAINNTGVHGIMNNGVVVMSASAGNASLPNFISAPSGFVFNVVANNALLGVDNCGGYPDVNGVYRYTDGRFLKNCWQDPKVYLANSYYSGTHYQNDHFRHPDGHSKILGFCTDGYPIYGPYAYSGSLDVSSIVIRMTSSYSGLNTDIHRPLNWKYWNTVTVSDITHSLPMGIFLQDYIYSSGLGSLDEFNGRYGITPDFPSGTYAYYLTFQDDDLSIPAFPYIFGTGTKQQRAPYSV